MAKRWVIKLGSGLLTRKDGKVDRVQIGRIVDQVAGLAAEDAVGRVSAEMICPYPPGVPVLSPGERITQAALSALFKARDMGVRIAFVADPSLETLKVLPKE